MPSQFIDNFVHPLTASSPSLAFTIPELAVDEPAGGTSAPVSAAKHALHTVFASFPHSQPLNSQQIQNAVSVLSQLESKDKGPLAKETDAEEDALKNAVIGKVTVGLYAEAMDIYLTQATQVEAEAEWWRDIERSRLNVAWYLLQSILYPQLFVFGRLMLSFQPHQFGSTT